MKDTDFYLLELIGLVSKINSCTAFTVKLEVTRKVNQPLEDKEK